VRQPGQQQLAAAEQTDGAAKTQSPQYHDNITFKQNTTSYTCMTTGTFADAGASGTNQSFNT
jgi:hypothetical protein